MPFHVGLRHGQSYRVYNFGYSAYGAHQITRELVRMNEQQRRNREEDQQARDEERTDTAVLQKAFTTDGLLQILRLAHQDNSANLQPVWLAMARAGKVEFLQLLA